MQKLAAFITIACYNQENHVVPGKYIWRLVPTNSQFKMLSSKLITIRSQKNRENTVREPGFSRSVAIIATNFNIDKPFFEIHEGYSIRMPYIMFNLGR